MPSIRLARRLPPRAPPPLTTTPTTSRTSFFYTRPTLPFSSAKTRVLSGARNPFGCLAASYSSLSPPLSLNWSSPLSLLRIFPSLIVSEKSMNDSRRGHCSSALSAGNEDEIIPTMYHSSNFLQFSSSDEETHGLNDSFALLVLNHDLPLLTPFLWRKARCRICADGGANRVYDYIPHLLSNEDPFEVRKRYKPDVIKGDLDSIRSEVKEFYAMLGTKILDNSDDQETTDMTKCLLYVKNNLMDTAEGNMKLLVVGALGGRLDHEFANLNSLYMFRKLRIILLSDDSMTFLLPKGYKHEIRINPFLEGSYCGLLPLSGASLSTTTAGLKWDLDKTSLEFGGLISTSNMPISDRVTISSDIDLVWTISLQHLLVQLQERISLANNIGKCL